MAKKRASSVSVRPPLKKKKVSVEGGPSGSRSVVHVLAVSHRDMIESCMWVSFQCVIFYLLSPFLEEHHRLVWTPDPSGHTRKGLGNNLARKRLAGMPWFLNPANFIFKSST